MKQEYEIFDDDSLAIKYEIIQKLGEGCFGRIYKVRNKQSKNYSALKLQVYQKNAKKTMLQNEAQLLQMIQGKPLALRFYNAGRWIKGTYIEIQLLEKDLNSLVNKKFSLDQISALTVKLLQSLSILHNSNVIHQDIKPQNIMLNTKGEYIFIDFGISKKQSPQASVMQKKPKKSRGFIGTPRYASIAAHKGIQQSKKDDLQSLFYNIAFLYFKKLPWLSLRIAGNKKIEQIRIIKQKSCEDVFQQMGKPFIQAFQYIKKLKYLEEPNYKYLYSLFKRNNTLIVQPKRPHDFQVGKKMNQSHNVRGRTSEKKYTLSPGLGGIKYLQLPFMGKEGFVDNIMTLDKSLTENNNIGACSQGGSSSRSKGFSVRVYNGLGDSKDEESLDEDMNIELQQDRQPCICERAKFFSPLLLKNPFSIKD